MIAQRYCIFIALTLGLFVRAFAACQSPLVSTESDPDAFLQDCVNIINGDYCEASTDLAIHGPDTLVLQRFYSTKAPISGTQRGGWRIFPERFLVIGKDPSLKSSTVGKDRFEWTLAFVGERSGGILPYRGWRNSNGITKDPLKIDILNMAHGIVNTYAEEMSGQTNHQNNLLHCKDGRCELTLGDGTKRIYERVDSLPTLFLGEEFLPLLSSQLREPNYFLLKQEILPSGNQIGFSYDEKRRLTHVTMKSSNSNKTISWISFSYEFQGSGCRVHIRTSDARELTYHLELENNTYQLRRVEGSHCMPISYEYEESLIRKVLPEGRFVEIEYKEGKVKSLRGPHAGSGKSEIVEAFSYGDGYTDVFNAMGVKTRYFYDNHSQLTALERYDDQHQLYRVERKYWGKTKTEAGLLLAKTIGDSRGDIYSYRSFQYDKFGNVLEERLYGNLTGKEEKVLHVSVDGKLIDPDEEECHRKTFAYSSDGFNLLTRVGDGKGNQTLYVYKPGTNLLIKKLIYDKSKIKKRTFNTYNEDGVCIKIVEDDGSQEEESYFWDVEERHIKEITPKKILPGVGLPEIIVAKALDRKSQQEVLVNKVVNTYDNQSNLLTCTTFDANDQYAFTERRNYNSLGQVISEIDGAGKEKLYSYDEVGNVISLSIPRESKSIVTTYDFHNKPVQISDTTPEGQSILQNSYDAYGRKIAETDRFGNSTYFEYDAFHRLTQISHPEVLDEKSQRLRPTFTYSYNIFGNVTSIKDPLGFVTEKSYNIRGDPTKIHYPDGSCEMFKYDVEGSLHRSLTRDQIITVYEYDYLGRSVYEESSTAGDFGAASFVIGRSRQYNGFRCIYVREDDHVKRYSFDPAGRLSSIVEHHSRQSEEDPESRLTEISYDPLGRPHKRKIWFDCGPEDFALECYEYDLSGNILEKRVEDAKGSVLLRRGFSYDAQGHCTEEYGFENGIKTLLLTTFYSSDGTPISHFDGLDQETKIIVNESYQNSLGQKVLKKTAVNPLGIKTEIEFDALGRIASISRVDPSGLLLSSQKIRYDAVGNKAWELNDQIVDGKIIDKQTTRWIHGPMGRVEEMLEAAGSSLEKRTGYSYNSLGQIISRTIQGAADSIKYSYNKDGRLHKVESDGNDAVQVSNSYSYDRKGNVTSAYSLHGKSVLRTYNVFNQVIEEEVKDGAGTYSSQYAYDRKGRLKEIILPDQSRIVYTYDAVFGREVKRISAQGEALYTHTYDQYDNQGNLLCENHIGYVGVTHHSYDKNGQKISRRNGLFSEQYARDSLSRLIEVKGEKNEEYGYNGLSQLISERKRQSKPYVYDSLDNRLNAGGEELFYNALNQLTASSQSQFSYDPCGNLLRKVLDGEETRFESNILSQLLFIEKPDNTALSFSYDPFGRILVEKHLNTKGKNKRTLSTTRYLYLGHQEIGTLSSSGNIETLKVPGIKGGHLSLNSIAFELYGETYALLHDSAGNVAKLVDPESLQLIESYEYTAFGEEIIYNGCGEIEELSKVGNPWRFAEKRFDQHSGLILFGLRFYDPSIGRWISQDPAGALDGPNFYAYLHNNPLNFLDHFGLATSDPDQPTFEGYLYGEVEPHCFCERHRTCKRGGDIGKTAGSSLPKITYEAYFEKFYKDYRSENLFIEDCYDNSFTYDLSGDGLPNLPNDMGIGFINGIWNDFKGSKESAHYLSRLAGGHNIHAVCNSTHGNGVDVSEAFIGLNYIATDPVRQLHKMWNSFFEKSSADAKFLMICHSQGAIHVRNALLDYPPTLRERILVVAIAPAGYIYKETCANIIHYRTEWWRDLVPRFDWAGALRERDSIITLSSHSDAALFDHMFMSPTYHERLNWHITNYIQSQGKKL